jgi:hypothetical protein
VNSKVYFRAIDRDELNYCVAGLCTKQNVSEQMWAYASAVMLGLSEAAASGGDPFAKAALERESREDIDEEDNEDDSSSEVETDSDDEEQFNDENIAGQTGDDVIGVDMNQSHEEL